MPPLSLPSDIEIPSPWGEALEIAKAKAKAYVIKKVEELMVQGVKGAIKKSKETLKQALKEKFNNEKAGAPCKKCQKEKKQLSEQERQKLINSLIEVKGTADQNDQALVATELSKLPDSTLQRLQQQGTKVVVCRNSVTDYLTNLQGKQPRGWPPGSTWDSVPGLYEPQTNEVVIAITGHGTSGGARVPVTGEGHGSFNLVFHETAHSLDHHSNFSSTPEFIRARNQDLNTLTAYELQVGSAGQQETFAESFARYYGGESGHKNNHPNLHNYWDTDPLAQTK